MSETAFETRPETFTVAGSSDLSGGWKSNSLYDPSEEERLLNQVSKFRELKDGWDGDGASAPRPDVISSVLTFLNRSNRYPYPEARPTPDGSIQLEWHVGDRTLEIEFSSGEAPHYLQWQRGEGEVKSGKLPFPVGPSIPEQTAYASALADLLLWVNG